MGPTYLEHATALLAWHRDIDVLFMGVDWIGKNAESSRQNYMQAMNKVLAEADRKHLSPGGLGFGHQRVKALSSREPMAFQRPMVRRTAFHRIGDYPENCMLWDCDWAQRAALDGKAALSEAPLYRQRVDDQGHLSRSTREREQSLSNIEIRERLAAKLSVKDARTRNLRDEFRRSAGKHRFQLAYQLQMQGDTLTSFKAWIASQRIAPQPRSMKLLLRILLNKPNLQ